MKQSPPIQLDDLQNLFDNQTGQPESQLDIGYYVNLVLRRRWFVIIPLCITLIAGIYLAIVLPKKFQAETLILIEPQRVPDNYVQAIVSSDLESRIVTIKEMILSQTNLGMFQQDVNVIWDWAPDDISILDYLMPFEKVAVSATGSHYYGNGICPKSLLTVFMAADFIAHINVSWVSPVKIRQTLIGGSLKMILYDDTNPSEKVKIYDSGVDLSFTKEELYSMKVQYRVGDMYAPKLEGHEALTLETEHFVDCLANGTQPLTGGREGLQVVKILAAAEQSLKNKGTPVELV
jgi:hypothetical protein